MGTLVNVKPMLPLAPQVTGLVPVADSVGARGAVIIIFVPGIEVQPDTVVISRLLYVPAGAVTVAMPVATVTPVKLPASYDMV